MNKKTDFDIYQLALDTQKRSEYVKGDINIGHTLADRPKVLVDGYTIKEADNYAFISGRNFHTIYGDYRPNTKYKVKPAILKITNP